MSRLSDEDFARLATVFGQKPLSDADLDRLTSAVRAAPAPVLPSPVTWLERVIKRRLIVHTTSGQTISGTLDEVTPDGVILRAASFHVDQPTPTVSLGGEVFIPREQVAFTQLLD